MWRESPPEKKNIFKSLAEQERLKYQTALDEYSSNKSSNKDPTKSLTPAMKKQSFDFDFPKDLVQTPEIPTLRRCGISEPFWESTVDELIVEDLGFYNLCHENEETEIALKHENVTCSNEKIKYYEVHVVKTPESLKNTWYDIVVTKELPKKLFESPESDEKTRQVDPNPGEEFNEPPELERCLNQSVDSSSSSIIFLDDVEMPVLEKENY